MPSMMSIVDGVKTKAFDLRLRYGLESNYVMLGAILLTDLIKRKGGRLFTTIRALGIKFQKKAACFPRC